MLFNKYIVYDDTAKSQIRPNYYYFVILYFFASMDEYSNTDNIKIEYGDPQYLYILSTEYYKKKYIIDTGVMKIKLNCDWKQMKNKIEIKSSWC